MSKLLDKLRAEASKTKETKENRSGGDFQKVNWFRPKAGEVMIRILPHWNKPKEELFFRQVLVHFGVTVTGQDDNEYTIPVRCLKDFEEDCPLCSAWEALDKDEKKKKRDLKATERYLYNIFDYTEKKFKVWAAPTTVHEGVFGWVEDLGDPADLKTGRDWKLIKTVDGSKGKMFGTKYEIRPRLKESALPEKVIKLISKETVVDLDSLYSENHRSAMEEQLGVPTSKPVAAKASKKVAAKPVEKTEAERVEEEEPVSDDEEFGTLSASDDDLEKELRDLGVS